MLRCTPMYVTDIQRNIGEMTVRPLGPLGPLPLVRQDYSARSAAKKIQAIVRGYQARVRLPMVRMTRWISENIITPKYKHI